MMASSIVTLGEGDPPAASLSFVAALAVHDMLLDLLIPPLRPSCRLKWPNDVLVDGAKISGILLEQVARSVVVGIGVNLAQAPDLPDRATTHLARLNGRAAPSPAEALTLLSEHFARRVHAWRAHGLAATLAQWEAQAHPRGTPLSVQGEGPGAGGGALTGQFDGLEPDGSLRLRLDDGSVRAIHAADVALI